MLWNFTQADSKLVDQISQALDISNVLTELLVRIGICNSDDAKRFLNPQLKNLDDPFKITNLESAVKRIFQAIESKEKILIYGDYDVDGVTSNVLLTSVLREFDLLPDFFVPRRLDEGYGLGKIALDRAIGEFGIPGLLIAVDCGTNSHSEIKYLLEKSIDVIIIDHHKSKETPPDNCILVNPHVFDDEKKSWSQMSAVGLVFKLIHGLLIHTRNLDIDVAKKIDLKKFLDLVAMGTIADIVPLQGENRILAKKGLARMQFSGRPGVSALCDVSGIKLGSEIKPVDVGFRLGPRINASGRLADATEPIELLLSNDLSRCVEIAKRLDQYNRERQEIEKKICKEAEKEVFEKYTEDTALVLYSSEWHAGVVGIVASRISQKFNLPTIVLGSEGILAKGSGRSLIGINLVDALQNCSHLLGSWGGHPMAVGVTIDPAVVEEFRETFNNSIKKILNGNAIKRQLDISIYLNPIDLTDQLLDELEKMHPFGQGNQEPIFGIKNLILNSEPVNFGENHYRFEIRKDMRTKIKGIAWKQADNMMPVDKPIDIAVKFNWNSWNGNKTPQLTLVDWKLASD